MQSKYSGQFVARDPVDRNALNGIRGAQANYLKRTNTKPTMPTLKFLDHDSEADKDDEH
jgi:hypothetical protein